MSAQKIKICHVVNIINGKSDGVYAHLMMLFKYLDADKYQQYLVFQGNPEIEEEVKGMGITVLVLPSLKTKFSLNTFLSLYIFLKVNNIDIIQAHLIKPYTIVGIVNIFLRKKAIFNYNGNFIDLPIYYNRFEEALYRMAHIIIYFFRSYQRVVVPSEASKTILLAESALFPRIDVYYNGAAITNELSSGAINENEIQKLSPGKYNVGIVARLEPQKRIDVAVEIVRTLVSQRNDVHFVIVGDGSLEDRIRSLTSDLQAVGKVSMVGYVANITRYLYAFDVILLTSDWEGTPMVMWGAMAQGVPFISSDVGGVREIVETEQCGRVYERRNVQAAVTILNELLDNKELRQRMGANGKRAIETKYNPQAFARQFEEIYEDVLKS
jgi:glycosyltransferase involved in cell wall biosynthesis